MNLRNWSMDHTKGVLLGVLTPLIVLPLVLLVISWTQDYYFEQLWKKFQLNNTYRIKMMTISIDFQEHIAMVPESAAITCMYFRYLNI